MKSILLFLKRDLKRLLNARSHYGISFFAWTLILIVFAASGLTQTPQGAISVLWAIQSFSLALNLFALTHGESSMMAWLKSQALEGSMLFSKIFSFLLISFITSAVLLLILYITFSFSLYIILKISLLLAIVNLLFSILGFSFFMLLGASPIHPVVYALTPFAWILASIYAGLRASINIIEGGDSTGIVFLLLALLLLSFVWSFAVLKKSSV